MIWFKYLKSNQATSALEENTNYSYPQVKRNIERFNPDVDILKGFWLSVDVTDLNIDSYLNNSLEESVDSSSYLVVYENTLRNNDFTPVETKILNNVVYFKAAEDHEAGTHIPKQYSLYYKTPNIQNVTPVTNGSITSYKVSDVSNPYNPGEISEGLSSYTVNLGDTGYYNFSFVNLGVDWEAGASKTHGAKVYVNFLGPEIKLYGSKGVNHGKFSYRIKPAKILPNEIFVDTFYTVDCYSSTSSDGQELLSVSNLEKREYILEIISDKEKNPAAKDSVIKLSGFTFDFDLGLEISKEYLSTNINFVSLNPTSSQGSVGGDAVYTVTDSSSSTSDVDVRDIRIRHIMEVM